MAVVHFVHAAEDVLDFLDDGSRRDAVFGVPRQLLLPSSRGFIHRAAHRIGDIIGIENHPPFRIARGAADGLNQGTFGAQETFLVGIENRNQRHLGQIQPLAQQIDADQNIEFTEAQIAQDFHAFDGINIRMQIAGSQLQVIQIFGQILGHALGQAGGQHAEPPGNHLIGRRHEIVHLCARRAHLDLGIDQPGRTNHLLDKHPVALLHLIRPRRGRHIHGLRHDGFKLLEAQRPVIQRRRQAEAEIHQRLFS